MLSQDELTSESVGVVAGKGKMLSARVGFERRPGGQAVFMTRAEGGARLPRKERGGCPIGHQEGGGRARQVLKRDQTPRTLVIMLHEEAVNQYPGMAYYEGFLVGGN